MPELTRRRSPDAREECWQVYYGEVHAGTIAIRTGIPHDGDPWQWGCGFYPGSKPGECTSGIAASFELARAAFEAAWRVFLSNRTEADFQAWRDQRELLHPGIAFARMDLQPQPVDDVGVLRLHLHEKPAARHGEGDARLRRGETEIISSCHGQAGRPARAVSHQRHASRPDHPPGLERVKTY